MVAWNSIFNVKVMSQLCSFCRLAEIVSKIKTVLSASCDDGELLWNISLLQLNQNFNSHLNATLHHQYVKKIK